GAELLQVGSDAGPLAAPAPVGEVFLSPGNRAELLVRVANPGQIRLTTEPVNRGAMGMLGRAPGSTETVTVAHVVAAGETVPAGEPPERISELADLRSAPVE